MPGVINIDTAGIGSILTGAGQFFKDIRTAITGKEPLDAGKAAELALKAQEMELKAQEGVNGLLNAQIELNKIEAASPNVFIAGWRPFIGWCCGAALAYNYIISPLVVGLAGINLPQLGLGELSPIIMSLLGLAAARTVEKINGSAGNH